MGYFDPGNYSGSKIAGIMLLITSASLVLYGSCKQVLKFTTVVNYYLKPKILISIY